MAKAKTDYRWISPHEAIAELARRYAAIPDNQRAYACAGNDIEQMQAENLLLAIQCQRVTRALLVAPDKQREVDAKILLRARDWLATTHSREQNGARVYLLRAEIENLLPDPAPAAVTSFRTGGAGKPTARDFITAEFERRVRDGEVVPRRGGIQEEGKHLSSWWDQERVKYDRDRPPAVSHRTAENHIRERWQALSTKA